MTPLEDCPDCEGQCFITFNDTDETCRLCNGSGEGTAT